jgi:hypothetical protein
MRTDFRGHDGLKSIVSIADTLVIEVAGNKVGDWESFIQQVKLYPNKNVNILLKRSGKKINLPVTIGWKFEKGWKKNWFFGC